MPAWSMALVVLAMLATVGVHWLFRSSRRTLEVATLRLFGDRARPRLSLSRLHEPVLLLTRLILLAAVALAMSRIFTGDALQIRAPELTVIIPGTAAEVVDTLSDWYDSPKWLDANLSDVTQLPDSTDWVNHLLALDQRLPSDITLRVVGEFDARDWPLRAPITKRVIEWDVIPVKIDKADWPRLLTVVVDDAERRSRLERVVDLWQSNGLLDQSTVRWQTTGESVTHPLIWWGETSLPNLPFGVAIDTPASGGPGWQHVMNADTVSDHELAVMLWTALIYFESYLPPSGAPIEPITQVIEDIYDQGGNDAPSDQPDALWAWIALLFAVERLIAARALQS
ncbi:MAG: BatA domain-containing protein [Pseudomonadota bacterium]